MKAIYLAVFVIACGSNGGGNNDPYDSCYQGTQACVDCTHSSCGSQVSAFESACSTYLACECPGGVPVSGSANDCQTDLVGACATDALELDDCEHTTCVADCGSGSD